ncbi:MAG: MotA/TolQ/ExbB proton channel family protein [Verrucomicrobia bacterium]|nr:MotA/TolQ/ExbB proton channel family protein [Verrucomicrobiota bacterium]
METWVLSSLPVADVMFAFAESNLTGKVIVGILFVGSIYAWSVMVTKFTDLRRARIMSRRFLYAFRKESHPIALYLKRQKFHGSPLYAVYENCCLAVGGELEARGVDPEELFMGGVGAPVQKLNQYQLEAVRNASERTVADQALLLEGNMGILATAVSASPFLGLLGTVWGVMDAFGGMAVKGSATLSAVAPGIAGALLTTVVGLLVALPSAIGYNLLTNRIRELHVQMDNFAQEFVAEVQRAFLHEE